eukprot:Gb_10288 [translate_table: standard]
MSTFQRELRIPDKAVGVVIGKGGSTIKAFQKTPGISSVRLSSGKVQIRGYSQKAVQQVASSIEDLVNFVIDKGSGDFPDFFVFCFCKSVDDPFVAVNRICFEKFDSRGKFSNVSERNNGAVKKKSYYCFKSGQACKQGSSSSSSDSSECSTEYSVDEDLSAQFCRKTSITGIFLFPQWDLQAYKDTLLSYLEPLVFQQHKTMRSIKLIIRFGKELFFGANGSELHNCGFMPLTQVQELFRLEHINRRFDTSCAEGTVAALRLHLATLNYVKVSSQKKISIHVADLQCKSLKLNVSVRCGNEGSMHINSETESIPRAKDSFQVPSVGSNGASSDDKVVISRVRSEPTRHGFVNFCREGKGSTDFRLGVVTHGTDIDVRPDMVEWIDKAWRNRTSDQRLVFDSPTRFQVMNIRYKESETYMTDDWKLRIAKFRDTGLTVGKMSTRWECALSSRWFKKNGGLTDDMEAIMGYVGSLVKEAAKVSKHMESSSQG